MRPVFVFGVRGSELLPDPRLLSATLPASKKVPTDAELFISDERVLGIILVPGRQKHHFRNFGKTS